MNDETDDLDRHLIAVYRYRQGSGTERPRACRDDPALYRQGGKGAEEPGEGHADADHRTPVDERGSESHDRPATGVQQLSGLFPVDSLLRGADIRFLSRNIKADGQYGRLYQTGKPQ